MDWGLVLASQGLEPTLEPPNEAEGWALSISFHEHQKALEAIRLYEQENRRWPWRREFISPGLLFDWGSLAWVVLLCLFFWAAPRMDLAAVGVMDNLAISRGQWWRLFTAIWLHADAAHLAGNATIGFLLLGLTMARFGTGAGLLAAYLSGAMGNCIVWLLSSKVRLGLGASGMVLACLGLLAIYSAAPALRSTALRRQPSSPSNPALSKQLLGGVAAAAMLFVLLGASPGTDVFTHASSFASGIALGALTLRVPRSPQQAGFNIFCGLSFVILVVLPWWLALQHR